MNDMHETQAELARQVKQLRQCAVALETSLTGVEGMPVPRQLAEQIVALVNELGWELGCDFRDCEEGAEMSNEPNHQLSEGVK